MNRFFVIMCALVGIVACEPSVLGSGVKQTKSFTVPSFKRVNAGGEWKVLVHEGGTQQVSISTDDNLLQHIALVVKDDELSIGAKERINPRTGLEIAIRVPTLDKLFLFGKARGQVSFGHSGGSVEVAGKARCTVNGRKGKLEVEARGAARLKMAGAADTLTIKSSGASWIDAAKLVARVADISGSDATRATVRVVDRLKLDMSGAASIDYLGNPKLALGRSDPSRVRKATLK
jgi:hypothetical protein